MNRRKQSRPKRTSSSDTEQTGSVVCEQLTGCMNFEQSGDTVTFEQPTDSAICEQSITHEQSMACEQSINREQSMTHEQSMACEQSINREQSMAHEQSVAHEQTNDPTAYEQMNERVNNNLYNNFESSRLDNSTNDNLYSKFENNTPDNSDDCLKDRFNFEMEEQNEERLDEDKRSEKVSRKPDLFYNSETSNGQESNSRSNDSFLPSSFQDVSRSPKESSNPCSPRRQSDNLSVEMKRVKVEKLSVPVSRSSAKNGFTKDEQYGQDRQQHHRLREFDSEFEGQNCVRKLESLVASMEKQSKFCASSFSVDKRLDEKTTARSSFLTGCRSYSGSFPLSIEKLIGVTKSQSPNMGVDHPLDLSIKTNNVNSLIKQETGSKSHLSTDYSKLSLVMSNTNPGSSLASLEKKFGENSHILDWVGSTLRSTPPANFDRNERLSISSLCGLMLNESDSHLSNFYTNISSLSEKSGFRSSTSAKPAKEFSSSLRPSKSSTNHESAQNPCSSFSAESLARPDLKSEGFKLVRGQDAWLRQGMEQTRQILRCIECGNSFKSLPELTVHMIQTAHYMNLTRLPEKGQENKTEQMSPAKNESESCICQVCSEEFENLNAFHVHIVTYRHYQTDRQMTKSPRDHKQMSDRLSESNASTFSERDVGEGGSGGDSRDKKPLAGNSPEISSKIPLLEKIQLLASDEWSHSVDKHRSSKQFELEKNDESQEAPPKLEPIHTTAASLEKNDLMPSFSSISSDGQSALKAMQSFINRSFNAPSKSSVNSFVKSPPNSGLHVGSKFPSSNFWFPGESGAKHADTSAKSQKRRHPAESSTSCKSRRLKAHDVTNLEQSAKNSHFARAMSDSAKQKLSTKYLDPSMSVYNSENNGNTLDHEKNSELNSELTASTVEIDPNRSTSVHINRANLDRFLSDVAEKLASNGSVKPSSEKLSNFRECLQPFYGSSMKYAKKSTKSISSSVDLFSDIGNQSSKAVAISLANNNLNKSIPETLILVNPIITVMSSGGSERMGPSLCINLPPSTFSEPENGGSVLRSPSDAESVDDADDGCCKEYKCRKCQRSFASKGSHRYHISRYHSVSSEEKSERAASNPFSPPGGSNSTCKHKIPIDSTNRFSKYYQMANELSGKSN